MKTTSIRIIVCLILSMAIVAGAFTAAAAEEAVTVQPNPFTVMINGVETQFESYLFDGRVYFRIRDLAYALNGTSVQFNVDWNGSDRTIRLYSNTPYRPIGGEMSVSALAATARSAMPVRDFQVVLDDNYTLLFFWGSMDGGRLTGSGYNAAAALNIGGDYFFALTNIRQLFGFYVELITSHDMVVINTHEVRTNTRQGNIAERFFYNILETGVSRMYSMALDRNGALQGWWEEEKFDGREIRDTIIITRPSTTPEIIMEDVIDFASRGTDVFVVTSDGILWGWGANQGYSFFENSTGENRFEPVQIMDNVASLSNNSYVRRQLAHIREGVGVIDGVYAIRTDGSLWRIDTIENGFNSTHIMNNVAYVSVGSMHRMAITSDGSLWGWGFNFSGQLGKNDTREWHSYPVRVVNINNVVSVSVTHSSTMAVTSDGTLWEWGRGNQHNPLGALLGVTSDNPFVSTPEPVMIKNNVADVSGATVIRTDGSLWQWQRRGFAYENRHEWIRLLDSGVSAIVDSGSGMNGDNLTVIRTDGRLQRLSIERGSGGAFQGVRVETIMENVVKAVLR